MKAMILAAGFGTRFRPVTYTLPKPMVPLLNRPLIDWAIDALLAANVRELVVNLHHLPNALVEHLRERYAGEAEFHFSYEEEILGTSGGIRRVRSILERDDEFFLVNGDTIQFPPWDALRSARGSSLAALTLRHPPAGDKFTAVYFSGGLVTGFGKGDGEPLMFSGSHLISSRVFQYIPETEYSSIVTEVYQPLLDSGRETFAGVVDDGPWFDIGTPKRYLSAMQSLLAGSGTNSTIGARSVVRGELVDTAVWDDCIIGANARLERCIVAHGVMIPDGATFRDALICRDSDAIPADFAGERRDGLVIVQI